jgi:DNA-binding transcriptional LysR family regulator
VSFAPRRELIDLMKFIDESNGPSSTRPRDGKGGLKLWPLTDRRFPLASAPSNSSGEGLSSHPESHLVGKMNLHHLELFYYVARHGGISRAVRNIPYGIQQPAVSSQMLLLEHDLQTKLFERRPFRLTVEGQELFDSIRPFFRDISELGSRLRGKHSPRLRIAASEIVQKQYLPAILRRIKKQFPEIRFGLRSGYQAEMEAWLRDGQIDFAITPLESRPQAGIKHHSIAKLPLTLLVPKSARIKSAGELWAREHIEDPLICLPSSETICRTFQRGLKQLRVDWPVTIEVSSVALVAQYVADGYGVGVTVSAPGKLLDGVRSLPLHGFDAVELAALWRPPMSAHQSALLALIQARAKELWPS